MLLDGRARLAESERLHQRVRGFALEPSSDLFEEIALEIAQFQFATVAGFRRLVEARGGGLCSIEAIPAVPVDAFRYAPFFAFESQQAARCFCTSGTTGAQTGRHWLRDLRTYDDLATLAARPMLLGDAGGRSWVVLALLPDGGPHTSSSLGHMCGTFMSRFDGKELSRERGDNPLCAADPARWLFDGQGTRLSALRDAVELAHAVQAPVLLLATAFALVDLTDQLGGASLPLPQGSVVMPTGGFKGRSRELAPAVLQRRVEESLGAPRTVSEYGMTELSSQLYQVPDSEGAEGGVLYRPPPWLRVVPVDPATLRATEAGALGLASFIDLGNVDSAVRIVTQDLVQPVGDAFRLLGRRAGAPLRGCSLAAEALSGGV